MSWFQEMNSSEQSLNGSSDQSLRHSAKVMWLYLLLEVAIVPHVVLSIPARKRHGPSSLMLSRLHIETLQWTFMAWLKICGSVFINFSRLWISSRMLLLCLDFCSSMAVRLQYGNKCRRLDYHIPGISAFTFFLLLCFLCHSWMKYIFLFCSFL